MDPLSATTSVAGILDTVTRLSKAISRFKHDYQLADEDLNVARKHALLLKEEIRALDSRRSDIRSQRTADEKRHGSHQDFETDHLAMGEPSFTTAMTTARELLSDIEASFPLRSEPSTWRSKVRWAMKDKEILAHLKDRLRSTESTLHGIVAMEQLQISRMIYTTLLKQQAVMDNIENGKILGSSAIHMTVINQASPQTAPPAIQAQFSEIKTTPGHTTQIRNTLSKPLSWTAQFHYRGVSAQLMVLSKDKDTSYSAIMQMSLFGRLYSVQLQLSVPSYTFDGMWHVRNTIPDDSEMAVACRVGDFDCVRHLLANGLARGSDVTASGWPMLDAKYAIESGSARLVRLLLDHGAEPDVAYGEYSMTALQSAFLRGKIDIARILSAQGADIEHVDSEGYSVLSYLWVVDGRLERSIDFMRLCLASGFSEVNTCDSRGWTAFHRAAAVGTPEDAEAFLRLGASLDLRTEWYGWTPLFFAASHDNVETFLAITRHMGPDVYESLDGDGWNLLHCCVYFGAYRVMKLVLQSGIDVNQKSHPAPLPEDPELSYRELTASDIALYIGPNRCQMFMDALEETGREGELEEANDFFWDAADTGMGHSGAQHEKREEMGGSGPIYGAEDVDDRWTLLHWASYNGSPKVKNLLLLKGPDPKHLDAIMLENNPTLLPASPFEGR